MSKVEEQNEQEVRYKISCLVTEVRLSLGLSQKEMAKRLNISHAYVAQIECGMRIPSIRYLLKIAHAGKFNLIAPKIIYRK